jgi:hypothetical protein
VLRQVSAMPTNRFHGLGLWPSIPVLLARVPPDEPTQGTHEHFLQLTALRRWGTIQEYVDLCRTHAYFTPEFHATAIAHMERIHVRRRLKQITNAHGWPVFGNIERIDPDGKPLRVFLQEELFGPEEYQ